MEQFFEQAKNYTVGPGVPSGWTHFWEGPVEDWSVGPGGPIGEPGFIYDNEDDFGSRLQFLRYDAPGASLGDISVLVRASSPDVNFRQYGVVLRGQTANPSGYVVSVCGFDSGNLAIFRYDNTSPTTLAIGDMARTSDQLSTFDVAYIRAEIVGNTIRAKAWRQEEPEPDDWLFEVVDSAYAAGGVGLFAHDRRGSKGFYEFGVGLGEDAPLEPIPVPAQPTRLRTSTGELRGGLLIPATLGPASDYTFRSQVPTLVHDTYGAQYPLTYVCDLPPVSSGLRVDVAPMQQGRWVTLPERARRFDGVSAVRFDYPNNKAYISAPFFPTSDDLYIRIVDSFGSVVGTYSEVAEYYDDRTCPVVFTQDDWLGGARHTDAMSAALAHQASELWYSPGFCIDFNDWRFTWDELDVEANSVIANGYIEPINHGRTHATSTAWESQLAADREAGGGARRMKQLLTMPPQSRRGNQQFVHGFIRPFGNTSAFARQALADSGHLADRTIDESDPNTWPGIDATYGIFNPVDSTRSQGNTVLDEAAAETEATAVKAAFDIAFAAGNIFHYYTYAYQWPTWDVGSAARDYLEYIGGFNDIWSVGFGHLYLYRYLALNVAVTAAP